MHIASIERVRRQGLGIERHLSQRIKIHAAGDQIARVVTDACLILGRLEKDAIRPLVDALGPGRDAVRHLPVRRHAGKSFAHHVVGCPVPLNAGKRPFDGLEMRAQGQKLPSKIRFETTDLQRTLLIGFEPEYCI